MQNDHSYYTNSKKKNVISVSVLLMCLMPSGLFFTVNVSASKVLGWSNTAQLGDPYCSNRQMCSSMLYKLKQIEIFNVKASFFAQAHFCRGVIDWSCRWCDSAMHEKSTLCRRSRCSSRYTRSFGLPRCFHHHQCHEKLIKKSRAGSDISRPRYLPSR